MELQIFMTLRTNVSVCASLLVAAIGLEQMFVYTFKEWVMWGLSVCDNILSKHDFHGEFVSYVTLKSGQPFEQHLNEINDH